MTDGLPATFEVKLVHVFDVRMNFHKRLIYGTHPSYARLGYVSLKDGVIEGPRLNGRIMEYSGADWSVVRTDGVVETDAHYMFETDDGEFIRCTRGYIYTRFPTRLDGGPACRQLSRSVGNHGQLERTVIVGGGERRDPVPRFSTLLANSPGLNRRIAYCVIGWRGPPATWLRLWRIEGQCASSGAERWAQVLQDPHALAWRDMFLI
jgi:hypothetical protein